jgi:outer membrane protein OmpU
MNTLKKVGLTALAGSLVAISANAGEMAVNGYAKATYTDRGSQNGLITGNPFGLNRALEFSGSGDLDNGNTIGVYFANNGTSQSSASMTYGMGDMGSIKLDMGTGGNGIGGIDDKTPTAAEEIWDNISYGAGHDGFRVGNGASGALAYSNTFEGVSINVDYLNQGGGNNEDGANADGGSSSSRSFRIVATLMDGLEAGLGRGEKGTTTMGTDDTQSTVYATYAAGPITLGWQYAEEDSATSSSTWETHQWGASFAVNENLAISYGQRDVDVGNTAQDETGTGVAVSYTMGSIAISANRNQVEDFKGTAATDRETTEIAVSFSF